VKNAYDADSKVCIVYFDNKYSSFLNEFDENHYNGLIDLRIAKETIDEIYVKNDEGDFILNTEVDEDKKKLLEEKQRSFKNQISKLAALYIIDFGEGMTQNIIRDHWMTIGTDNKANNIFTKQGRVKSGAKGIGRFALDKLGSRCEMTTIFNPNAEIHCPDTDVNGKITENTGYQWLVNWEDFEGDFKTIDKVGAKLTGLNSLSIRNELVRILPQLDLTKIQSETEFK